MRRWRTSKRLEGMFSYRERSVVALGLLSSVCVFAQDLEADGTLELPVPSVSVNVRVNPGRSQDAAPRAQQAPRPPPARVVGAENFDVAYDMQAQESLRLLSPEGAHADVWADDGSYVGGFDLPTEVRASAGQFYRVLVTSNGVVVLDRKLELRRYFSTVVSSRRAPSPAVVETRGPRAAAMVDFPALVEAVKHESFSDAKLDVVRTSEGGLTVDQLGQLIDLFSFASEQVKVVEFCQQRLVDRQNAFKLYQHFTFDGDKQKVKALLGK